MRRTRIVIIAITLLIICTMLLLLNTKVQNIIVKVLHHKELKSYKLLAYNNSISSPSYEVKNVIHGSLDGSIMFDTLHKVFVIGTNKKLLGRDEVTTFWKVNTHGDIVDSVTVANSFILGENGLLGNEKQYLDWVHTGEKAVKMGQPSEKVSHTLLKVTSEELKQFPQLSLKRSYFFRRKQRNGNFIILRPNSRNDAKGYEGPAYFDLTYYGETIKFKAYDFESEEGPKTYLNLWAAPKGYESPQIHFLYLPDIMHLPHYSEAGIYVIRPKGSPSALAVNEHINGFFETSTNGQDFALSDTAQTLKLNMKTFIPLTEVSSYSAVNVAGQNKISITFTPKGDALFKAMTGRNLQMPIAFVIEGRIVLAPHISGQVVEGKIDIPVHDEDELDHIVELLDDQKE